ncbi:serine hydrolase domain-containing protein [Egicoccus halophilus]|uniref:Serine hydrolase n=1 Tax=Egicoccus halophilus TaxID=1670830 RepID=A0A8J3AC95_9ACTN|nr:serine hydrolase domain-containing protein [Egicoccus halophilus]GGI04865.1 serine hydrolase [Egicoccus halophilus]
MSSLPDRAVRALEDRLADEQRHSRLPSVVAGVVREGVLAWSGAAGKVDGAAPTPRTQYRIGSITKTFVGLSVLRLVESGRVDLDDRVTDHVPDAPVGRATLLQLLAHASGLRAETAGPWWERTAGGDWNVLLAQLQAPTTPHRAGHRHHYSNVGYAVLGRLLEGAHGRPWHEVVHRDWLGPLDLTDTTARPRPPFAPGLAVHPWADTVLPEPEHDAGAMAPAGQLWAPLADLARWAAFLAGDGEGLLDPALLDAARRPVVVDDRPGQPWRSAAGLSLQVFDDGTGRRSFGHGGSMPGFLALLRVDADSGDGAVVMTNTTAGLDGAIAADLLGLLAREAPRRRPAWTPGGVAADALALTGVWYWGPTPVSVTALGNDTLRLEAVRGVARSSRFRRRPDGGWEGLDGYYAGEVLRPATADDGTVRWFDLASFVFTRMPYDADADVPGGVAAEGWR